MSVKIYMTNWCPYCRNAKTLLNNKGVSYEELNIDELGMTRNDLYDLTGGRTVPQIIINKILIGGFDDLFALNQSGDLDGLLVVSN
jgi:GrxC family glutaredoxin|tara:strand:- start:141 stop:398 length:258 start_codon:yes stop_codon:yes gene_type:complete